MRSIITLRGVSATGKGTRVSTLLEYLKTKYEYESIFISGYIGKEKLKKDYQIGVIFPSIKLFFLGKWVRSNKMKRLISWSSLDGLSGYQDTLYYDLPKFFVDHSIIWEGYYGGRGAHLYPSTLISSGVKSFRYFHYLYNDIEELQERCLGRSGSRIKGSCYSDNVGYLREDLRDKELNNLRKQFEDGCTGGKFEYTFHPHTTLVQQFGIDTLFFLGLIDDIRPFKFNIDEFSTLRDVNNSEVNHLKYEKYLGGDTDRVKIVSIYNEDGTYNNQIYGG